MKFKSKFWIVLAGLILVLFTGGTLLGRQYLFAQDITLYPRSEESWVGDPMPYFDGETFQVFYLEDLRDGDIGFHPWSLLETSNFYEYSDSGIVIPYVNDEASQELALGTGSVIEDQNGLYHAFYTGHNGNLHPKEAIMHATSNDLKNWNKLSENTFFGSEEYDQNDFRDPFVFYNEDEQTYWMLITTRKDDAGVIALYTSDDLNEWADQGVFFENDMGTDSNLECPSLVFFNDKWYLAFSDQWPDRVVHYRVADSLDDTFVPLEQSTWDGNGFYAGRLETDGNSLYIFGWVPTKEGYTDLGNYNWAGNLVVHELVQQTDGSLHATIPAKPFELLDNNRSLPVINQSNQADGTEKNFTLQSEEEIEWIKFENIEETTMIQGEIYLENSEGVFGFRFNAPENIEPSLTIAFRADINQVEFYNRPSFDVYNADPISSIELDITAGEPIEFKLVKEDDIVVLFLNGQKALTTRMYQQVQQPWEIFAENTTIDIKNLRY